MSIFGLQNTRAMKYFFLSVFFAFSLMACEQYKPGEEQDATDKPSTETPEASEANASVDMYPSFSFDSLKYLWEHCDYLDVLYYDLPASMSMTDTNSIRQMLGIIAAAPAPRRTDCGPAIGRLFFQIDGENYAQADLYFSDKCKFFVFVDDKGKARWGNLLTDRGVAYFQNSIGQILDMSKSVKVQPQKKE